MRQNLLTTGEYSGTSSGSSSTGGASGINLVKIMFAIKLACCASIQIDTGKQGI
jgi:hypothetical protein